VECPQLFQEATMVPMSDPGPVVMVDMGDGTTKGRDLPQASTDLAEALKVGRRTWVIVE
jgi:hypothetical protein